MKIEAIEVEAKLQVLATNFSNSYFTCMYDQYAIVFKNSNVIEEMETLDILSTKLDKRRPSVIINRDRALLASILDSYTYLIGVYKTLAHVTMLSPKFKRYDMVKYLHDWCKASAGVDVKGFAKEIVKEILSPEKEVENLSRAEQVKRLAQQYSDDNKIKLYKGQSGRD